MKEQSWHIWTSHLIAVLLTGIVGQAAAQEILFEEGFAATELPPSLNYVTDPDISQWQIDESHRLHGMKLAWGGSGVLAAISVDEFMMAGDALKYSADMGKPDGTEPGGSNIGLRFGNYTALFHPGYYAGGFRLERGLIDPYVLVNNQDMGFTPAVNAIHHVEALVQLQGSSLAIDITVIGLDADLLEHTFTLSYLDPSPSLNTGEVGVAIRMNNAPGTNDGIFDNLRVESVPTPTCLACDLDGDGLVDVNDFLILLGFWGPCGDLCLGDIDGDGAVGVTDFLELLANWGPCP